MQAANAAASENDLFAAYKDEDEDVIGPEGELLRWLIAEEVPFVTACANCLRRSQLIDAHFLHFCSAAAQA